MLETRTKILLKVLAGSLLLIGLCLGLLWLFSWRLWVWTNDAQIDGFGTDLGSNVTEQVIELFVDEGDFVKKGDIIARLRDDVPRAKKEEAMANIIRIEQEILVRTAYLEKIRNDYTRAKEGIADQVISAQDFDHKQKDFEMADGELKLAMANLELAKKQLEVVETELTHYQIYAPMDGAIAKRWIWVGDVVSPGQSLYTMYDLQDVWTQANLEEEKIRHVRVGQEVDITVDAYPGYVFKGEVFAIKGAAASQFTLVPQNNATGNYTKVAQRVPVKMTISPPDDFPENMPLYLFPGMNVEVWFRK